jgi:hypothetical protein
MGGKSLFPGAFPRYPQWLWISLWMPRGEQRQKPVSMALPTHWAKFNHVVFGLFFNSLESVF